MRPAGSTLTAGLVFGAQWTKGAETGSEREGGSDDAGQGTNLGFILATTGNRRKIVGGGTVFLQVRFGCHVEEGLQEGVRGGQRPVSRLLALTSGEGWRQLGLGALAAERSGQIWDKLGWLAERMRPARRREQG